MISTFLRLLLRLSSNLLSDFKHSARTTASPSGISPSNTSSGSNFCSSGSSLSCVVVLAPVATKIVSNSPSFNISKVASVSPLINFLISFPV